MVPLDPAVQKLISIHKSVQKSGPPRSHPKNDGVSPDNSELPFRVQRIALKSNLIDLKSPSWVFVHKTQIWP